MNILLIALLPLVAFVLRKRILSISYVIKNNLKERLKSEVLFMSLTISLKHCSDLKPPSPSAILRINQAVLPAKADRLYWVVLFTYKKLFSPY
jgi:hypothetical protein